MATATRPLNVCPTNVKEALEWLAALGADGSGATACERVIQQILGSQNGHTLGGVCQTLCQKATEFMTAIKQGNGYASTYQTGGWNNLCQPQGRQCCATTNGYGACSQCHGAHCTGCCKNCPKQICARIFCLIVPVVYSALWYLYSMLQLNNGRYSSGNGNTEAYLRALGFNKGGLSLTADLVRQALQQQQQQSSGTLLGALGTATREINTALQYSNNIFVDGQSTGGRSTSHSGNNLTTPTSAKDLMLWTIFLPYCCDYQYVHGMLRQSLLSRNGGAQSGPHGALSPHSSPLDNLMSGLHVLFIGMEYGGQGHASPPHSSPTHQPPSTLFEGINMVCQGMAPYEYYTNRNGVSSYGIDGTYQCLKLLIAGIPIISWAVEMLLQQNGGAAHGYGSGYGNGLEQALGFSTGMQQLSSTLGQQIIHDVHSMVQPIKTAYANNQFQVLISIGTSHTSHSQVTPTTFREMLLWLQGLPCSQGYNAVRELLTNGNSGSSGPHVGPNPDPLVGIIFRLPHLFYSLDGMNTSAHGTTGPGSNGLHSNGTLTAYITELFQRQGIQVKGNGATGSKGRTGTIEAFSYHTDNIKQTFCAIVAVVYYVVDHLKRKSNGAGGSHYITTDSLGAFLEFLGWQGSVATVLSNGSILNGVLELCFGNGSGTAYSRGTNGNHLSDLFQKVSKSIQQGSKSVSSTAPTTFRDTLLCLVGAPLTQGYDSVNKAVPSRPPSHSSTNIESDITDTIVGILQLFNKLEGSILSAVLGVFKNGGTSGVSLKYNYGVTDSNNDVVGTLCGTTVVMRSVFGFLQQRCNRSVAPVAGTDGESWHSCNVTCANGGKQASSTTQCTNDNNHLCKFLCLLGWNHTLRGGAQSTTTKDSASFNGTTFHTLLLECFGDLASQDQGASSSYYSTSNGNEPVLEKLYQCAVQWFQGKTKESEGKGTDSSTTTKAPTTIREMMLWLIGLPLHSVYTELTGNGSSGTNGVIENKFESLKSSTDRTNNMYNISTQLTSSSQITNAILSSSQGMIITMLAIEGSIKSVWDFLTKGLKTDSNTLSYGSGSDSGSDSSGKDSSAEACFSLLVDYTYKVHFQLRFLLVMCSTPKDNGGWKDCEYRGSASGVSGGGSSGAGSSLECKCNGKSSPTGCPMPLYNFLNGGGANKFKNTLNGNGTSDAEKNGDGNDVKMGFSTITLSTTPSTTNKLTGADIHALLKYFVDTVTEYRSTALTHSPKPFSLLAQCIVAIGQRAPSTLGDCFELVRQMGYGLLRTYVEDKLKAELKGIMLEVTGGQKAETALITAIQNIIPNSHSDHNNDRSLMSLMCDKDTKNTSGTNGCAPYMKSLSSGLYSFYLPSITGSSGSFPFLQYLYDRLRQLLDKMKELKKEFDACECCKNTGKSCTDLISCQCAHPILYKFGFVFGEPKALKSNNKKCDTLKTQLGVVLSCTQQQESALFSAFECVIQVTYKVLLDRAKECITKKYPTSNGKTTTDGLQSTKTEMNTAFTLYVHNAMYDSYPKLICTFACKVFKGGDCDGECEKFRERITKPEKEIKAVSSADITVSSTAVTSITAVIPQYTAPVIDRYHYRMLKKSHTESKEKITQDNKYVFSDAIDFHVKGAQCIRPAPVALRSVIDWILRITTGASATQKGDTENGNNSNISEHIKGLSKAVQEVFKESGLTDSDVQQNVIDLVQGLRKFVGYEDRSGDVISKVGEALGNGTNGNGVKKLLGDKITAIKTYLENKEKFGSELGKALLKGQYECKHSLFGEVMRTISAVVGVVTGYKKDAEPKTFKDVITTLQKCLTHNHTCQTGLKCTDFQPANSVSSKSPSNGATPPGLKDLYDFFTELKNFAALWTTIGKQKGNGSSGPSSGSGASSSEGPSSTLVRHCCIDAEAEIYCELKNKIDPFVTSYFSRLQMHINLLGKCAQKVSDLENKNGSPSSDSTKYRTKITELINELKEALEYLKGVPLDYVVDASNKLLQITKEKVDIAIPYSIKTAIVENAYGKHACSNSSGHPRHQNMSGVLCIETLIQAIESAITSKCNEFKSHLDDLKQLCQWLYRMGQLYAHGLKGFVESLVKHLEHIVQVIKWIEGIEKMMTKLKEISKDSEALQVDGLNGELKDCCQQDGHGSLYNSKFKGRDDFFTALNCRIDHLLGSYVLHELPKGSNEQQDDKAAVATRIKLLRELRLLALDRYTLQVWQDECNPNGGRQSAIKNWITFEGGIVRHSDLEAVKTALHTLTGVAYNNASPSATPSASHRIHNFHAICVIQKFSYEAPIIRLERSLEKLKGIKDKLSAVKEKCDGGTQLKDDPTVTSFCTAVTHFLSDPYGVYSFAIFVHTIMGPNIFSAVIAALEELTSQKLEKLNGNGGNLDKIKGILGVMTEGLDGEKKKDTDYKLENICKKLEAFITTLRREYIFAYPVVTANKASLPAAPAPSPPAKTPTCDNRDHSMSSICAKCHPFLARIFIGAIPNLYRHCRLLYEMCNLDVDKKATWNNDRFVFERNGVYAYNDFYLSFGGYMSRNGWIVKGANSEMDEKELYELNPDEGGSGIYGNVYDIVSLNDPFKDSDLKPLDKLFKAVMQHFKDERNKKREQREQELRTAFYKHPNNKGIPFQAPPAPLPSTVRQVLFWLHEMDTNKAFYDGMSQHIHKLCQRSSIRISHDNILHVLNLSITQCLEVLSTIEDPGRQNADYLYDLYTEEHYYAYPDANIPLFFYTFVEKLMGAFLELNFVCVQCEFVGSQGGWKDCEIGKSEHSMEGQNCRCTKPHTKASPLIPVTVSGSVVCPRPLSAFLFSDQKNQLRIPGDVSQRLPYMSKGTMPCGFQLTNKAITDAATQGDAHNAPTPTPTSVSGSVLVEPLQKLVGGHVTGRLNDTQQNTLRQVIYLRDLLRYTLCLAVRPPWSMSENMAFFYRVTESWKKDKAVGSVTVAQSNTHLLQSIHAEIALFPWSFKAELLTTAVERFAGIEDEKHQKNDGHTVPPAPSGHHQYDLRTLMGCQDTNTAPVTAATTFKCSTFMFPLSLDVYTHYDQKNSRAYLSWILNFAFGIYGQLRGLEEMIKGKECVRNASQSNPSDCPSLPMCPGVLTALYQSGSSFMDQKALADKGNAGGANTTKRTCNDFHSVLQGLLNCDPAYCTPLHNLIVQCEAFLWSIRLPFSLVQLSLWSVAILFISYVFVVPLDHFKIKSHLFNRLKYTMHPSLLIADQQRRVSEVAYFSL